MRSLRLIIAVTLSVLSIAFGRSPALYLSLDFSLDNQTYGWSDSLLFTHQFGRSAGIQLWNRSTATLIKQSVLGESQDRWQKRAQTVARVERRVSNQVAAGIELRQDFERLEKRRYIGTGAYLTGDLDMGALAILHRGGVVWEQREYLPEERVQSGFGYESEVSLQPSSDGSLGRLLITGDFNTLRHTPKKSIAFDYNLIRSFTGKDTTSLHAGQAFGETNYFPSSSDFSSSARQRDEQRQLDFDVRRELPAAIYLRAQAAYRLSSYDYEFEGVDHLLTRQNDNLRSLLEYRFDLSRRFGRSLRVGCEYLYSRAKEDFGTQQVNQKSETGQLAITAALTFLATDTVTVSAKAGVTSYIAPTSSEIFSDRDRTIEIASIRAVHRFTEFLRLTLDGSFRGFHTIYISGSLSANNNINNVYILNPSLIWQPLEQLTIEQNYRMHANYIYYDFEKSSLTGRNTIYRRANFSNRVTLGVSPRSDLSFEYSYRYEDFGPIRFTDQWQQQVSWDRRTHRPKFTVDYHPSPSLRFQPYAIYEIQRSFDHLFDPDNAYGRREQSEEFERTLVGFDLELALSQNSYIECRLERRVQEYQNQRNQDYDLFTIALKKRL